MPRRFCLMPSCNYSTYDGSNYKKHLLKHGFHAPASTRKRADPNSEFFCERCNVPFVNAESMRVHNRTKHKEQGKPKLTITCNKCSECFHRQDNFSEHYFLDHMEEDESPVGEMDFETMKAFEKWLDDFQKKTKCELKRRGYSSNKYLHYRCVQAGKKDGLKYKTQKSAMKRVAYCTAFVNAIVGDRGTINVVFCEKHNHIVDLKKARKRKRVNESDDEAEQEQTNDEDSENSNDPEQQGTSDQGDQRENSNSETLFVCPECSEQLSTKEDLQRHRRARHPDKFGTTYLCRICKTPFTTERAFGNHINDFHPIKKNDNDQFICPADRCPYKSKQKEPILNHLTRSHARKTVRKRLTMNSVPCDQCPAAFPNLELFYKHFFEVHFNETYGNFVDKSFSTREEFRKWVQSLRPNAYGQIYIDSGGEKRIYYRCNGKAEVVEMTTQSRACSSFINASYADDGSVQVKYFPDHNHGWKMIESANKAREYAAGSSDKPPTINDNDQKNVRSSRGWWNKRPATRTYFDAILEPGIDEEVKDPIELLSLPNLSSKELEKHIFAPHQLESRLPLLDFNECLDVCFKFLAKYRLIANTRCCKRCFGPKNLTKDSIDCYKWICEKCWENKVLERKGIRESIRALSIFDDQFLNLRNMMRLLATWCEDPGADRFELAKAYRTTYQMVLNIQKKFAAATERWYIKHKKEEKEKKKELEHRVKQEVFDPEDISENPCTSGTIDVTTLLGGSSLSAEAETKAVVLMGSEKSCHDKIKEIKKEDETEPEQDVYQTVCKTDRTELHEKYKVIGLFPQVFVYDFLMRKHFGEDKLMNRFLYEITQFWDVDADQPIDPLISLNITVSVSTGPPLNHLVAPKEEPLLKKPKLEI